MRGNGHLGNGARNAPSLGLVIIGLGVTLVNAMLVGIIIAVDVRDERANRHCAQRVQQAVIPAPCELAQSRARAQCLKHTARGDNVLIIIIHITVTTGIRRSSSTVDATTRSAGAVSTGGGIGIRARRTEQIVPHVQPRQTRAALHLCT